MSTRTEIDKLVAQSPTWKRATSAISSALSGFPEAARIVVKRLRANRSTALSGLADRVEAAIPQQQALDLQRAESFDDRVRVCMKLLASGQWTFEQTLRLREAWGVTDAALSNYRRAGTAAIAAVTADDIQKLYEQTLASFRVQADEAEALAKAHEAKGEIEEAIRYRELQRRAEENFAEIAGLRTQRVSVSLEADPRIAGLWTAILAALEDLDRMREAYVGEVEKLTGGVVPTAPLPAAGAFVRDAVRRYEGEIGARKLAA